APECQGGSGAHLEARGFSERVDELAHAHGERVVVVGANGRAHRHGGDEGGDDDDCAHASEVARGETLAQMLGSRVSRGRETLWRSGRARTICGARALCTGPAPGAARGPGAVYGHVPGH